MRSLELKIPPVVVLLILGAVMWGIARFASALGFALPAAGIIAATLTVTGLVIALLGVASFRRARTTVNPLQPAATTRLVISGIYRWTRNPMYLGMLLVLLGWAVFLTQALAFVFAVAFIPLMNLLQIGPEEKILAARFGAEFSAYQATVRRWL